MKDKKRDPSIRDIREMGTLIIFQKNFAFCETKIGLKHKE